VACLPFYKHFKPLKFGISKVWSYNLVHTYVCSIPLGEKKVVSKLWLVRLQMWGPSSQGWTRWHHSHFRGVRNVRTL